MTILSLSGLTKQMRQELVLTLNSMRRFHKDCFGNQMVKTDGYNLFCSKRLNCPNLTLIATLMINRSPYIQRRYCFKVIFFIIPQL